MLYLLLAGGFVLLIGGAEAMIRGAVALAKRFGISPLVIGMTVIAFGTSLPELLVSLEAGLTGAPGIAVGNIIGSNIANILLILGAAAAIRPPVGAPAVLNRDTVILAGVTVGFAAVCWTGVIGREAGFVLVALLACFLISSYWRGAHDPGAAEEKSHEVDEIGSLPRSLPIELGATLLGLAGLAIGSDLLVRGGVGLAREFGVSEEIIGLTLVAFGTSLPELAASAVAALRGHADVAFGNIVGSNIFNMLAIGGIVSIAVPLPVAGTVIAYDIWVMLAATVLILPVMTGHLRMSRPLGIFFFAAYVAYITSLALGVSADLAAGP